MFLKKLGQQLNYAVSTLNYVYKGLGDRFLVDIPFNELQGAKYGDLITIHAVREDGTAEHIVDKGMLLKYGVKTENVISPYFNGVETSKYVIIKDLLSKESKKYYLGRSLEATDIFLYVRLYSTLK